MLLSVLFCCVFFRSNHVSAYLSACVFARFLACRSARCFSSICLPASPCSSPAFGLVMPIFQRCFPFLRVCLPASLPDRLLACVSTHLSACLPVYVSACLLVYLTFSARVCPSICPLTDPLALDLFNLTVRLTVCLTTCPVPLPVGLPPQNSFVGAIPLAGEAVLAVLPQAGLDAGRPAPRVPALRGRGPLRVPVVAQLQALVPATRPDLGRETCFVTFLWLCLRLKCHHYCCCMCVAGLLHLAVWCLLCVPAPCRTGVFF